MESTTPYMKTRRKLVESVKMSGIPGKNILILIDRQSLIQIKFEGLKIILVVYFSSSDTGASKIPTILMAAMFPTLFSRASIIPTTFLPEL